MSYSPWGSHKESDTTRHAGTHCYRSQGNGLGQWLRSAWQEEEQMMLKKSLPLPFYIRSVSLFALSGLLVTRATAESAWEGATLLCLPRNCQSPLSQSPWPHSVLFPTGSLPEPSNPTKKVPRFPCQGISSSCSTVAAHPNHHLSHYLQTLSPSSLQLLPHLLLFSCQPAASLPTLSYSLCLPDSSYVHSFFPCTASLFSHAFVMSSDWLLFI